MVEEAFNEAINLFDTEDKWNAFILLHKQIGRIKEIWGSYLNKLIKEKLLENTSSIICWKIQIENKGMNLKLESPIINNFNININLWEKKIYVLVDPKRRDINKIKAKLKNNSFFIQKIYSLNMNEEKDGNYIFILSFAEDKFLTNEWNWGNKTEKVAQKLKEIYLDPILNEDMMQIIKNICQECEIKNEIK